MKELKSQSIQNKLRNKFSKLGRDILQSQEVLDCLRRISDNNDFYMWQNMFFDKSTGTINHIDTWHLDTSPRGFMIAGWFALENSTIFYNVSFIFFENS